MIHTVYHKGLLVPQRHHSCLGFHAGYHRALWIYEEEHKALLIHLRLFGGYIPRPLGCIATTGIAIGSPREHRGFGVLGGEQSVIVNEGGSLGPCDCGWAAQNVLFRARSPGCDDPQRIAGVRTGKMS